VSKPSKRERTHRHKKTATLRIPAKYIKLEKSRRREEKELQERARQASYQLAWSQMAAAKPIPPVTAAPLDRSDASPSETSSELLLLDCKSYPFLDFFNAGSGVFNSGLTESDVGESIKIGSLAYRQSQQNYRGGEYRRKNGAPG